MEIKEGGVGSCDGLLIDTQNIFMMNGFVISKSL